MLHCIQIFYSLEYVTLNEVRTGKEYTLKPKQNKLKAKHSYLKTILINVKGFHVSCCRVMAHAQPYTLAERAQTASTLENYM